MALFLLKQKVKEGHRPGVNEIVSMVVRAANDEKAREFAAQHSKGAESPQVWRDSQFSTCEEIVSRGPGRSPRHSHGTTSNPEYGETSFSVPACRLRVEDLAPAAGFPVSPGGKY